MAHESFEDEATAQVMNERFVNVKVDREERPDVDAIYMDAVTAMTGHGGWPMSVFLTPDTLQPFYGGTYWPRQGRPGMPAFLSILDAIDDAWNTRRGEVIESAAEITRTLDANAVGAPAANAVDLSLLDGCRDLILDRAWDRQLGGFGRAPKFPQAMTIGFLLDHHARTGHPDALAAAVHSLDAMARGGINDHVGGGFARYSTDARWLAPHFEKMLYDNGLLLAEFARAAVATGHADLRRVAMETADYLLREMRPSGGGFQAATDADSDGVEGKYFVWSRDELTATLRDVGLDAGLLADYFGATEAGNWEGVNILHEPVPRQQFAADRGLADDEFAPMLAAARRHLVEVRAGRVPPAADGKVLTSWNGLAIRGLALAGRHLDVPAYTRAAVDAAQFLRDNLIVDGRLHHTWMDGRASVPALLEDHAHLGLGLLALFEATGDPQWFTWAEQLAEEAITRFHDGDAGGFHDTAHDAEQLYRRPKDTWDNATPSGNSVMANVALRLAAFTGEPRWHDVADEVVRVLQPQLPRNALGQGMLLQAMEFLAAGQREVVIVGPRNDPARRTLTAAVNARLLPGTVIADVDDAAPNAVVPAVRDRLGVEVATAWVCQHHSCQLPVTTADALAAQLG